MAYRIVVTEVTLYGPLRCVAGVDLDRDIMIRPEPEPAGFWPARFCGDRTIFHPGHVVRFAGDKPQTAPPHNAEDIVVRGNPYRMDMLDGDAFRQVLARTEKFSPTAVFGDHLRIEGDKAYVPAGSPCGSLACLTVGADQLRLFDHVHGPDHKLQAELPVAGGLLHLSVAAKDLKQAFKKEGLAAARALAPKQSRVHVRLGLARPFKDIPDRCYLQVNGIHGL